MKRIKLLLTLSLLILPALLVSQAPGGVDPASLLKPLADTWPTYSGDYTGRRYSALKQIDQKTVKNVWLAWVTSLTAGGGAGTGGRGGGAPGGPPMIVGGEGTGEFAAGE